MPYGRPGQRGASECAKIRAVGADKGSRQARRPNGTFKHLPGRRVGTVRAESDSRMAEAWSRRP
jgi:hypothetical protein